MLKEIDIADNLINSFTIEVKKTDGHCPIGETIGERNIKENSGSLM
jgi:hypothetical protein